MRHPEWIKVNLSGTHETKRVLRRYGVNTVCEEARCPNIGKCFRKNTATFMILGDRCTRRCGFCAVNSSRPLPPDPEEPLRVAEAAHALGLDYVVITSVTRDDLADGGASQFVRTIRELRNTIPDIRIEVLTPDFRGDLNALKAVVMERPDVFNHNVETVPRLYPEVRPGADYNRSLMLLEKVKEIDPELPTKSGIMVGLGETESEVLEVMRDLRDAGCELLTIGQYLQPKKENIPVVEYIRPEIFERYRDEGYRMGFKSVVSSPLARSSMDAREMIS